MIKHSLAAIQREMNELKKVATPEMICMAFIDSTDDPNTFEVRQNVYASKGMATKVQSYVQRLSTPQLRELVSDDITEEKFDEIIKELKIFPEGCDPDKNILFTVDFGGTE